MNFRRERLVLFCTTLIQSVTCLNINQFKSLTNESHALNYPALPLINYAIKMDNAFNVNLSHTLRARFLELFSQIFDEVISR